MNETIQNKIAEPIVYIHLIEDDSDHSLILGRVINKVGRRVRVKTSSDGQKALMHFAEALELPDLIFLDINMPGLSGFDTLRRIKAMDRIANIPVVMLTSSTVDSDIAHAYELGASGYITKPGALPDLQAILGNTLLYWTAYRRSNHWADTAVAE
jgi:CheY-like chemotaxis protein